MKAMEHQIQTSTPIIHDKLLPPPPRRLWGLDSATQQLYLNKWVKYRNSIEVKEASWGELDAPRYVDFEDIPEDGDSYFDHVDQEKYETPPRALAKPLPGSEENNNLLQAFENCALSAIKKAHDEKHVDQIHQTEQMKGVDNSLPYLSGTLNEVCSSTIKSDLVENMDIEAPASAAIPSASNAKAEKQPPGKQPRLEKKSQLDKSQRTIIEPFSFETREKCKQIHKQARRERDSIGKETWKGFRANPVPNFIKLREKKISEGKAQVPTVKRPADIELMKLCNVAKVWKNSAFQPSLPKKKLSLVPKAPELLTAARARERKRFEDQLREKELQRQAQRKLEEAARKKQEQEEIAKLRKEMVHKAQPIRKYKFIAPKVEKRPLPDPTTPMVCKRRRITKNP